MKLNELFSDNQLNEAFGGVGSAIARKMGAALDPTKSGEGARDLEKKTEALTKNWMTWRGQTKAVPNSANIEKWVKSLGLDDPEIWAQAVDEYSEEYPKSARKYRELKPLDAAEISNFFNKLIQIRLLNPDRKLWTQKQNNTNAQGNTQSGQSNQTTNSWSIWQKDKNQKTNSKNGVVKNTDDEVLDIPHTTARKTDTTGINRIQRNVPQHPEDKPAPEEPAHPNFSYSYNRKPYAAQTASPEVQKNTVQEPTKPVAQTANVETGPGNAGNVNWDEIRKRFPEGKKTKPRISIPMGSNFVPDKPRYRVPAGSSKV